jgi:hypothetical protein
MSAEYRGTEHPELRGRRALLQRDPGQPGMLLAQFDEHLVSPRLPETRGEILQPGKEPDEEAPAGLLWYLGWHPLPAEDFHKFM